MKNLFLITLLTAAFFTTTSCKSDDDKIEEIPLTGAAWKLTSLSVNGTNRALDECELLDTYSFTDDGKFTFDGNEKEASGECAKTVTNGTWTADNSVAGSRRFNITFTGETETQLLTLEGDVLREVVVEGPNSEGLTETFSYVYSRQ
ncbi:lipocalin family protein [Aquimarina algiphila]|uniref:lipocalin family protein n=1 Tax=Aquimarina algiphila TaxID=2047982 RepID=UPI00232D5C45|nr:lipocalin family protein [Aquimarina algiphila]